MKFTLESGLAVVAIATDCGDHPCADGEAVKKTAVKTLYYNEWCSCDTKNADGFGYQCNSWCDRSSEAVLLLSDGRFARAYETSDTTGHGCQCHGVVEIFNNIEDLLTMGVTNREHVSRWMDDPSP